MRQKNERKRGRENNSSLFEELLYMDGISKKTYFVELPLPTEEEKPVRSKKKNTGWSETAGNRGLHAFKDFKKTISFM